MLNCYYFKEENISIITCIIMIIFFFDNSITFRMARISKTYFGSEKNVRQLIISFDISFYIKPNAAFIRPSSNLLL